MLEIDLVTGSKTEAQLAMTGVCCVLQQLATPSNLTNFRFFLFILF